MEALERGIKQAVGNASTLYRPKNRYYFIQSADEYDEALLSQQFTGFHSWRCYPTPNYTFLSMCAKVAMPYCVTQWGEYMKSKKPGWIDRYTKENKHPPSVTSADEQTSNLNNVNAEKFSLLAEALKKTHDDVAPCHPKDQDGGEARTVGCEIWIPQAEEADDRWRENRDSCIVKHAR